MRTLWLHLDAEDIEGVEDAHAGGLCGEELFPEALLAQLNKSPRLKHQHAVLLHAKSEELNRKIEIEH